MLTESDFQQLPWVYFNSDTNMGSEVCFVPAHFRIDVDHRYKVIFTDHDSDNVVSVHFFFDFDDALAYAEKLVFATSGKMINGPVCVPAVAV